MKTLSVRQPWAWLLTNRDPATGKPWKPVENRDWRYAPKLDKARGPLLIHAGKQIDRDGYEWVQEDFPHIPLPPMKELETGGIVGIVYLDAIVDSRAQGWRTLLKERFTPAAGLRFLDWFFGPLGFIMSDGEPLKFHPCNGQLGFYDEAYPHPLPLETLEKWDSPK